ncbi:hypothetical protein ACFL47_00475 [Candidatus Latescibacterota bacterium]
MTTTIFQCFKNVTGRLSKLLSAIDKAAGFLIVILIIAPLCVHAEIQPDDFYGPPIEFGGSAGYFFSQSYPVWSAREYKTGSINVSLRIFRNLSVQGGYEGSLEEDIDLEELTYSDELVLENVSSSNFGAPWLGLRYEIPATFLKTNDMKIHSFYGSIGYTWAKFSVSSSEWRLNDTLETDNLTGTLETDNLKTRYTIANVSGPYGIVAARWRFDSNFKRGAESWFGSYGLDVGVKYSRFSSSSTKHDKIEEPEPSFSAVQIFAAGFIKMSLFE